MTMCSRVKRSAFSRQVAVRAAMPSARVRSSGSNGSAPAARRKATTPKIWPRAEEARKQDRAGLGRLPVGARDGRAAQQRGDLPRQHRRLLAPQDGIGEGHQDPVGERGYGHVDQFLGGLQHVQAAADRLVGGVQEA
jgi:hypothetical protein